MLRELLHRFRPAGAPGAARQAAVPADRTAEAEQELRPMLTVLASMDAEAAEIRAQAETEAGQRRRRAGVAAERIVAAARRRAQVARAEVFAAARAEATRAGEAVLVDARREADAIRARGAARLDAAVPSIVAATLDEVYHTGRGPETP